MTPDNTPIIVGVAQYTAQRGSPPQDTEPLLMMERVARQALADSESSSLASAVDSVRVVNVISWTYSSAAHLLASRLGLAPGERLYSTVGGNTPQWLANRTAEDLLRGKISAALLVGADAWYTARHASRAGWRLDWTLPGGAGERDLVVGDRRVGWGEVEARHDVTLPVRAFALFENAMRARRGLTLDQHRQFLARLCARFSAVAKDNPNAWFHDGKGEETISTVTADNRMIAFPYPKFMNAMIDVDQAAAVVMTTPGLARRAGVPRDKWVYLVGSGNAYETLQISRRRDFVSSPGIRAAASRALGGAGIDPEGIDLFDLYSCFPIAPQMAAQEIGIDLETERPLTVTGGLAYFGGPGNNYSMHAIATVSEKLRRGDGRFGLVYALGWYFAKHAVGIYSHEPVAQPAMVEPPGEQDCPVIEEEQVLVAEQASGPATIETYTVVHEREGNPCLGIVVGRLDDGRRFIANTPADTALMLAFEREEFVGARGKVIHDTASGRNIFSPSGSWNGNS